MEVRSGILFFIILFSHAVDFCRSDQMVTQNLETLESFASEIGNLTCEQFLAQVSNDNAIISSNANYESENGDSFHADTTLYLKNHQHCSSPMFRIIYRPYCECFELQNRNAEVKVSEKSETMDTNVEVPEETKQDEVDNLNESTFQNVEPTRKKQRPKFVSSRSRSETSRKNKNRKTSTLLRSGFENTDDERCPLTPENYFDIKAADCVPIFLSADYKKASNIEVTLNTYINSVLQDENLYIKMVSFCNVCKGSSSRCCNAGVVPWVDANICYSGVYIDCKDIKPILRGCSTPKLSKYISFSTTEDPKCYEKPDHLLQDETSVNLRPRTELEYVHEAPVIIEETTTNKPFTTTVSKSVKTVAKSNKQKSKPRSSLSECTLLSNNCKDIENGSPRKPTDIRDEYYNARDYLVGKLNLKDKYAELEKWCERCHDSNDPCCFQGMVPYVNEDICQSGVYLRCGGTSLLVMNCPYTLQLDFNSEKAPVCDYKTAFTSN